MTLRAVFLDVGQTLLYEEPSRFELYAQVAQARGREITADEMARLMAQAHHALPVVLNGAFRYSDPWFRAFIQRIFGDELDGSPEEVADVQEELFDLFERPETFRLYPGALELLKRLRADGLTVGVVSNWSARLPRVLEVTGLAAHLDFALSSALEGVEKPDSRIFEIALERAGVGATAALHAGDHPERDYEGARRAGLDAILVDHSGKLGDRAPMRPGQSTPPVRSLEELGRHIAAKRANEPHA